MTNDVFTLEELEASRAAGGGRYLEFLRVAAMSAGLYALAANAADPQSPHAQDELYFVTRGRAKIRIEKPSGTEVHAVTPGSVVFVAANVKHQFFDIAEDLQVLVFFAPAEA